jgi:hypothetical protein
MLTWLFTSYRTGPALFVFVPLLLIGGILSFAAAFALGRPGQKAPHPRMNDRERRLMTVTLLIDALAAMHLALLLGGSLVPKRASSMNVGAVVLLAVGGLTALAVYRQLQDGGVGRCASWLPACAIRNAEEKNWDPPISAIPASSPGCRSPRVNTNCICSARSTVSVAGARMSTVSTASTGGRDGTTAGRGSRSAPKTRRAASA